METKMPKDVLIVRDTCDGEYGDLIGQVATVVIESATDDPRLNLYTIVTNRPSKNPYMEGKFEEVVASCDVKILSYHD
ncbi:hypothetical protein KGF86_06985 [Ornithinibacillus massiliensis]|uniref:Uncharacterized protein n=1 Tax=Ornithinibacillus massiliensis TaxID=1944633 RepID=A0ABS5MDH0_9BACI|nr:hypothetical protein [Ornithinibacillus massiliensis]MBS3679952.1 hypothetical protein [Ornithinibacillus massiliensis]